ncbi:MAG: aldo/keto reductase [Candidatus Dormibacteraeota bacterium]|nr:aldo/keto reductase [Candidatus Dormibacteraeota bacterium]
MDYRHLGRSGLSVSPLCLGTMNFGPQTSEAHSHAIMDQALDAGINFFDTANVYGGRGATEEIIGRWFARGGGRREKVILGTKLYGSMTDWPNDTFLSAHNILRACDASLRRLQTDHLDLYQFHHVDMATPWEEIWQAVETLVRQGKVVYAGSSNFGGWHIALAQETARSRHIQGLVSEQSLYNLVERRIEMEVIPAALHYGLGILPWSPLAGGVLGDILRKQREGRSAADHVQKRIEPLRAQLERFDLLCNELGSTAADVSLAWLLAQPAVTAPIIGPRTAEQLAGNLRALDVSLDDDALRTIDDIFPPVGPSPQAYAW